MLEHFPVWCATQAAVGRESLPDVFVGKGLPTYNHICACIRGVCRVPNSHRYAAAKNALGLIHIAAFDGVLVDVVHFLAHDRFRFDELRVIAFFPNLVGALGFVMSLE